MSLQHDHPGLVFFILLLGVVVVAVASLALGRIGNTEALPQEFARAFAEACLISIVLALTVDSWIKLKLLKGTGEELLWIFLKAPDELRKGFITLSQVKQYYDKTVWTLTFDWFNKERDCLRVQLKTQTTGWNLAKEGYKPSGTKWVMSSLHGMASTHDVWRMKTPTLSVNVELDAHDLNRDDFVVWLSDGTSYIDESAIWAGNQASVKQNERFMSVRGATIFRCGDDFYPLVPSLPTLEQEIVLKGNAISELDVRGFHAGRALEWEEEVSERRSRIEAIAFPDQVTLISWKVKTIADDSTAAMSERHLIRST